MFAWRNSLEDNNSSELKMLLKKYNLTRESLSETLGISAKTLRNYIDNPNDMPLNIVNELCCLFNKRFDELFISKTCDEETLKIISEFEYSNADAVQELTNARDLYIDGFDFFEDNNSKGFIDFKRFILSKIHKPLLTILGANDSDVNEFLSVLLNKDISFVCNPIFFITKNDLPEILQCYEKIAIKTNLNEDFNIFLLNDLSYLKKFEYEEYVPDKEYSEDYIVIQTLTNSILQKCNILGLPNLSYDDVYRKNKPQNKTKRLSDYTVYSLIRFIQLSDFILYFENTLNFFTTEKTQIIQYLIDNSRLGNSTSRILFIETKCKKKKEAANNVSIRQQIEKINERNEKKNYFNDGRYSFKRQSSSIIDCIEQLNLDFKNITLLLSRIDAEINVLINSTLKNGYVFNEKSEIKQLLLAVVDTKNQSAEEDNIENRFDREEQNNTLLNCLENFKKSEEIRNILSRNIKTKDDMIFYIQSLSEKILKNYLDKYDVYDKGNLSSINLITNNILIPYFLLEMTFKIGNEITWANKITEEFSIFEENSKYSQIIAELIEHRVSNE